MMQWIVSLAAICATASAAFGGWTQLPSMPDKEGFAGTFAGVSNGALLVAGGAKFPDKKPWEGGKKVWYDNVFILDRPGGQWKVAGTLPRPLGYGVAVTYKGGLICVGGSDADRHHADVYRLNWADGQLSTTVLPSLPKPIANACGAIVGDSLYIAGGQEKPDSTETLRTVYRMNLAAEKPDWQDVGPCPTSGRILAVAASIDGAFYLAGGTDLGKGADGKAERRYLKDFYRYRPDEGWVRLDNLPHPVVAAPSPAPADETGIHILGGDDGSQLGVPPDRHQGFASKALFYDIKAGKWRVDSEIAAPRVTTPCVLWNQAWVIPTGEMHPGTRSPEVWSYATESKTRANP